MLRLGTNWYVEQGVKLSSEADLTLYRSNGNALSQVTIPLPPSPQSSASSPTAFSSSRSSNPPPYTEQHIALFPSFIFTSHPGSPLVRVHLSSSSTTSAATSATLLGIIPPPPGWSSPTRPDTVTAICADQSVEFLEQDPSASTTSKPALPARLAVFYQSGGFVVLRARLLSTEKSRLSWIRESIHPPQARPRSLRRRATTYTPLDGDPVVLASMHYPVLLTCTLAFHLSVYTFCPSLANGDPSRPKHLQTMHSDVSFHPATLSLFPTSIIGDNEATSDAASRNFRAALTYCTPLYPSSWIIAVQEFGVDLELPLRSNAPVGEVWRGECWNVGCDDEGIFDKEPIWPRKIRPVVGVKGNAVGVGMDGRWCVLAGENNQIQVYSLPTPSPSPPPKSVPIVHSQTLLAHSAAVTSISLWAGRCVSGGRDGRVLIWELDQDLFENEVEGRTGRTVGYVEVRQGGRRTVWRGAAGPGPEDDGEDVFSGTFEGLPHPQSISSAARSLFLPRPPDLSRPAPIDDRPPAIRQLAFDEEKIVGLIRTEQSERGRSTGAGEVMKVWNFSG